MSILVKVFAYLLFLLIAWLWLKTIPATKKHRWILILLALIPSILMDLFAIHGNKQVMWLVAGAIVSAVVSFIFTKALQLPWWRRILFALGHALIVVFGMTVVTIVMMVLTVLFFQAKSAVIA
jgi:peptidoglycan/LPS O-acetylase OafA/YrhL